MLSSAKILQKIQLPRLVLLIFLLIVLIVGAVPGYITGKWSWKNTAKITNIKALRKIKEDGLNIPEWEKISNQQILIADHKWLYQVVKKDNISAILLVLTQNGPKDQPAVEWMDINGFNRWKTDSYEQVEFTLESSVDESKTTINARFFRGWTNQQTYAVMQWYAWPGGGSPEPGDWFWSDRLAMIYNSRLSWVAVNILVPIEPLGDIQPYLPEVKSLGKKIQASLIQQAFK